MTALPANIYSVASVREFDRTAIEDHGIPGYTLMQRAGQGLFDSAVEQFPDARQWVVVCGAGNNAGDGYVIATLALQNERLSAVISLSDTDKLSGDAKTAFDDFIDAGGKVESWNGELPENADLLVDAILGSGLARRLLRSFFQ